MKMLLILTLVVLLVGCRPDTSPSDKSIASKEATAEPITYSGGDGSTMEKSVIIKGADGEKAGVDAEYAWLRQKYPGYRMTKQALKSAAGRRYDLIEINTSQEEKSIYFDITDFFGK